jgi:branched-chain amino acid transport system permease protein
VTRRGSNLLVWAVTILGIVFVSVQAWGGKPVTATSVIDLVVLALPFAGIYALAASGLVVVYTTTGIFNFAQGAIGMLMAYVYWQMTDPVDGWGLPPWLCLLVVVFVIAPLFGVLLDRLIMRHLQGKPLVVQLMVTVGMMFAIIALAGMIWNQNNSHSLPFLFQGVGDGGVNMHSLHHVFPWYHGDLLLTWHRLAVVLVAVAVAIGMRVLLFGTRLGIAMRAVVDNRDLAALGGARASVLSSTSWAIGCMLAALAVILIAPEVADMSTATLSFLVITAFSAAVVGRLRSLPLTYLGAFILALVSRYFVLFLSFSGRWLKVDDTLPTIMLLIVLLLLPRAKLEFGRIGAVRRIERVSSVRDCGDAPA